MQLHEVQLQEPLQSARQPQAKYTALAAAPEVVVQQEAVQQSPHAAAWAPQEVAEFLQHCSGETFATTPCTPHNSYS